MKSPDTSAVTMTELVLPQHTNALGTIFGGTVMGWIDIAAAIAAQRHSARTVVTAAVDALHFLAPIRLGHVVTLQARVNHAWTSSMEVGVRVDSENPRTGEKAHNVSAYLTFVALDESGKPTKVTPVDASAKDDKRRSGEAQKRKEARLKLQAEILRGRST